MNILKTDHLRYLHDERAATVTEFGLVIVPFAIILLGTFDLGYQMYVRSVLQGTLANVARKTSVENPQFSGTGASLEERIQENLEKKINSIARNATYSVSIQNFQEFSGIGKPEKLTTDVNGNGQYDDADGDCWQDLNGNGTYDTAAGRGGVGGASDVIFYEVQMTMPRLFPMAGLIGASEHYNISAKTTFKSQPFGEQQVPSIKCGGT